MSAGFPFSGVSGGSHSQGVSQNTAVPRPSLSLYKTLVPQIRIASLEYQYGSLETLPRISLKVSHLNNCYYHQDLH